MKPFDDSKIERQFRAEQQKTFEEKKLEEEFRRLPLNQDGTRSPERLRPAQDCEMLASLMLPKR